MANYKKKKTANVRSGYVYGQGSPGTSMYGARGGLSSGIATQNAAPQFQMPSMDNKYQSAYESAYNALVNRSPFKYSQKDDPLYQQYEDMYTKQAKLGMENTVGQVSALTGGYANSYAQTAGQAMYQQIMGNLNEKALDLYNAALNAYGMEGDRLAQNFNAASTMYGNEQDNNRWNAQFAYQQNRDAVSDARYANEWAHQLAREQIEDDRYQNEWDYRLSRDDIDDARYDKELALKYYQAGYDPVTGGMSAEAKKQYDEDMALKYYQAGYDPKTGGMSKQAQKEYNDSLALGYAKLGLNPDGTLNAIGKQNDYETAYKQLAAQQKIYEGNTERTQLFIQKKGRIGNNKNPDGILTRKDFERTVSEGHQAHVMGADKKGKVSGKGYTNYVEYVDAWLDTQPQLSEKEKDYLFYYYTYQE